MQIIVFKSQKCGYCKSFVKAGGMSALAAFGPVVDADLISDRATHDKWQSKLHPKVYPEVFVLDDAGKKVGSFNARSMTAAKVTAKMRSICPSCEPGTPAATKTCPTCNGSGVVAVLLCALLSLCAACISQKIVFTQPLPESAGGTNDTALVVASYHGGSNATYRARANVVISMGIYSTKKIDPETTATIPLK